MAISAGAPRVRFGSFVLDLRSGELTKHAQKRRLQRQSFVVLRALLRRAGEVVTREDLQNELWPDDVFVDEAEGLNAAVRKLRQALDDDSERPRFVETLPRVGYRFIGTLEFEPAAAPPSPSGAGFRLSLRDDPQSGALVITCDGRLGDTAAGNLRSNVRPRMEAGRRVVLDLGGVSQIDSVGIGALVALFVSAATSGSHLDFTQTSGQVLEVLKTTGLASVFSLGQPGTT